MPKSGPRSFWEELRRRKVVRSAVAYLVVAWVLIQVAEATFEPLRLPEWTLTLVVVLAGLGFPLALVLAWTFDLGPGGLQRERPEGEAGEGDEAAPATLPRARSPVPVGPARADKRRAIAVLPLTNMSQDPDNEYFSDGLSEEILNLLARIPELRVVSRTSSFSFKDTKLDVPTIAEKLGVDIVLEGSVRRAGNRARIVVQLIDAANDAHLWSESYDRELEDIFAVQDDIARRVVAAMNLDPDVCEECAGNTRNMEAYDYYLRGRQYFHQTTHRNLEFARQMFRRAIELDPGFARAHAGLADTESLIAQWLDRSPEHLEAADAASRRALELAPALAEAHASRGFALSLSGDYEAAAEQFEQALKLDPEHYESLYLYARCRFAQGRLEQAAELYLRAHEVQPDEFQALALGAQTLKTLGRDEAHREASREAVRVIERRLELNPDDLRALSLAPGVLIDLGRTDEALALAERAIGLAPNDASVLHNAACAYARAGRSDEAIELLERRIGIAGTLYRDWMEHDSDFDGLREDPRFKALLERMPRAAD